MRKAFDGIQKKLILRSPRSGRLEGRRARLRRNCDRKIAQGLASLDRGEALDGEAVIAELLSELDRPAKR